MSTPKPEEILDVALGAIPKNFRQKLIEYYLRLKQRLAKRDYEASGLSAGKFCEMVLRTLQHEITGTSISFNKSIGNFYDECRKLIIFSAPNKSESLRVIIPRALAFLYTFRNKRSIGHQGGDVDPNAIDAATIARAADWVMCELIRCFHSLSLEDAQALVDSLSIRHLPDIWEVQGRKRVLRSDLESKDKALLLLYSCTDLGALSEDLCLWTKYSSPSMFKTRVLRPLDAAGLVDYDEDIDYVVLSPLGVARVEDKLLDNKS
jgi:hypothetical protein